MATNAIETAKQENGSKLFFQSVIEQNKPTRLNGTQGRLVVITNIK